MPDLVRQTTTASDTITASNAARASALREAAKSAKRQNASLPPEAIATAVDEALEWAKRG